MNTGKVRRWMRENAHLYRDDRTNELNQTRLAEEAANVLNLFSDKRDFNIPEEVFELAAEIE
jgi:hypothetical protein